MQMAKRNTQKSTDVHTQRRHTNGLLTVVLLLLCMAVIAAYILNIMKIARTPSASTEETLEIDTSNALRNDQYTIGNNPTDIQKEYFEGLTDALDTQDEIAVCDAVVRCFVSDFFTWTNKDGNYDVGGLEYIYGPKMSTFEQWSRYNFYEDFDLYLHQYGRNKLIEVDTITNEKETFQAPDFTIVEYDSEGNKIETTLKSYEVNVGRTYKDGAAEPDKFPTRARFYVVNHNGCWEIAEFYDLVSVEEWESTHGGSSGTE